jgi:hypothetical protein
VLIPIAGYQARLPTPRSCDSTHVPYDRTSLTVPRRDRPRTTIHSPTSSDLDEFPGRAQHDSLRARAVLSSR